MVPTSTVHCDRTQMIPDAFKFGERCCNRIGKHRIDPLLSGVGWWVGGWVGGWLGGWVWVEVEVEGEEESGEGRERRVGVGIGSGSGREGGEGVWEKRGGRA